MQTVQNGDDSVTCRSSRHVRPTGTRPASPWAWAPDTAEPTDRLGHRRDRTRLTRADAPRFVITMSSLADTNAASGYPPSVLIWSDGMCSFRVTLNTHQGLVTAAGLSVTHVIVIRLRLLTRCPAPAPGRRPARAWQPPAPAARWAFPARPAPGPAHACAPPPPEWAPEDPQRRPQGPHAQETLQPKAAPTHAPSAHPPDEPHQ